MYAGDRPLRASRVVASPRPQWCVRRARPRLLLALEGAGQGRIAAVRCATSRACPALQGIGCLAFEVAKGWPVSCLEPWVVGANRDGAGRIIAPIPFCRFVCFEEESPLVGSPRGGDGVPAEDVRSVAVAPNLRLLCLRRTTRIRACRVGERRGGGRTRLG